MNETVMSIDEELKKIAAAKYGNKEIAVFYNEGDVTLLVGNPSEYVNIGESGGEFAFHGNSVADVMRQAQDRFKVEQSVNDEPHRNSDVAFGGNLTTRGSVIDNKERRLARITVKRFWRVTYSDCPIKRDFTLQGDLYKHIFWNVWVRV